MLIMNKSVANEVKSKQNIVNGCKSVFWWNRVRSAWYETVIYSKQNSYCVLDGLCLSTLVSLLWFRDYTTQSQPYNHLPNLMQAPVWNSSDSSELQDGMFWGVLQLWHWDRGKFFESSGCVEASVRVRPMDPWSDVGDLGSLARRDVRRDVKGCTVIRFTLTASGFYCFGWRLCLTDVKSL